MRGFRIYLLIIIGAILAGCEKDETPGGIDAREVRLFANMGVHISSLEQTKAIVDGVVDNSTNEALTIGIVRLDEHVQSCWPYFRSENQEPLVPLTAELGIPDNDEGGIRIVSNFKNGSDDAPQFFMNSQDSIKYTAWYPGNGTFSSTEEKSTVTFNIPVEGNMDIMYAEPVVGKMGSGFEVMKFKHALSLFRIYVYKNTSLEWGNVKSITLSNMPDVCTLTLPKNIENNTYTVEYSDDGTANTMNCECDVPVVQGIENKTLVKEWIAAPAPGTNGLKMLSFTVETAEGDGVAENTAGTHSLAIAQNFLPGYAYDIILRFSDAGTVNAEVQISDWGNGSDINSDDNMSGTFYDLSANGTANCYIVSSANFAYCFDATVKGNGNTIALGGGIETTLNPKTVEIVWIDDAVKDDFVLETASEVDGITRGRIVEGKVLFRVIGTRDGNGNVIKSDKSLHSEGNVLLGVRDEAGNMLWTWHIWITDKPQKQNYTRGYIALDRNLGATAAAPEGDSSIGMYGLFYQWGRPTPFQLYQDNIGNWKVHAEDSQTRVIPDVAVANPGIFYGSLHDHDGHNVHDWVDRTLFQNINNLWGYREVEHSQPVKTIYDPCPVGYHVPYHRSWELMEEFWNKPEGFDENKEAVWQGLKGIEFIIEGNSIWYPLQGYININGEYKHGHIHKDSNGNYHHEDIPIVENWSSLVNRHDADDAILPAGVDERINDSPYRLQFTRDYLAKLSEDGEYTNRTRGLAVRCVSDNTADVVKDLSASQTANCYMVYENGFYKFKATVRGNGVGSLLPLGGTTTAEINGGLSTTISPAKVDVLWWQGDFTNGETDFPANEIVGQDAAPANMCINLLDNGIVTDDGYVAFQIKDFKKGNTILAAYDNAGNILWTWHIWLTDKPADKISGNYTKMDRFLGATYAPSIPNTNNTQISWPTGAMQATLGFYYQWGKKDPIIGPPAINSGTSNENGDTVSSAGWWIKDRVTGKWQYRKTINVKPTASIPDVVKDPTAFYKSTTTQGARSSQWFPESFADGYTNVALWGYAVADYSVVGQTFSKTMHDPCPPGYRTPFHFSWRYNASEKYAEGDDGEAITDLTEAETGFSTGGFVTNKTHFEKMWFPYAGYRNPLTGAYTNVGTNGYMNTGMPMGQYNTRSFWYGKYNSTQWGTGQYAGQHGSAYGKMVRCIKE